MCQQTAQQSPHRKVRHPRAGVLSLDTVGPLVKARDAENHVAKFFLAGAFTWAVPADIEAIKDAEAEDPAEVPDQAPVIEEAEEENPQIRDEPEESRDEVRGDAGNAGGERAHVHPRDLREEVIEVEEEEEEGREDHQVRGEDEEPRDEIRGDAGNAGGERAHMHPRDLGEEEGGKEEGEDQRVDFKIKTFRLAIPMATKSAPEVTRAAMEMVLQLKMDGYTVNAIHTDRGREFLSSFRRWTSQRGIILTQTPGDDHQGNGRVEQTVKELKNQVRRTLLQGGADSAWWPWALRYVAEVNRSFRTGKEPNWPSFMQTVVVRKRRWKRGGFEPTMEHAVYLAPSPENHGHWIQSGEDRPRLTRCILRRAQERPDESYWLALERETLDALSDRRRLRGKSSIRSMQRTEKGREESREESEEEESCQPEEVARIRQVIEEEMQMMFEDDPELTAHEMFILGKVKKMIEAEVKDEEVLQTKIISSQEVIQDWSNWLPAVESEVASLIQEKEAFKEITKQELEVLIRETHRKGGKVEVLPSKLVFTKKPAGSSHKKKVRWVVCGNYEEKKPEDTYSAGADAAALRLLIAAASYHQWEGGTLDVRTAFLNADMKAASDFEVLVIRPPQVMYEKGVIKIGSCFIPLKAVYGFRRSPKLWGNTRDDFLSQVEIQVEIDGRPVELQLIQMESEPNLWKVVLNTQEEEEDSMYGLLMTYVDDMLVVGKPEVVAAVMKCIRKKWETSEPDSVDLPIRFLGMEISRTWNSETNRFDWYLTQESYIRDMLQKEETSKSRKVPISRDLSLTPEQDEEHRTAEQVKEAQKAVGEALWLVTRTRPDIMYATSKMGSSITKHPKRVLEIFENVKGYLNETADWGLLFKTVPDPEVMLEAESDASFAPQGSESHGAYLVKVCNCPIFWRSGRQGLVSLSTAEAEMIEVVESMIAGESVSVVALEMFPNLRKRMWSDSQSAVAILTMEGGNWRTRHLRMRAAAARQAIRSGEWAIQHCMGENLAIDAGTKALSSSRFEKLREGLGMKKRPKQPTEEKKEEKEEEKKNEISADVAANVLKLITAAAIISTARGQGQEEEDDYNGGFEFHDLVIIYTVFVVGVTLFVQWILNWGVGGGNTQGEAPQRRSLSSGEKSQVPSDAGLASSELAHTHLGDGLQDRAGSAGVGLARTLSCDRTDTSSGPVPGDENPGESIRNDADTVGGEPGRMHFRDQTEEEEEVSPVSQDTAEDQAIAVLLEEEFEKIKREEEEMWRERQRSPGRFFAQGDDPGYQLSYQVLMTRFGSVYHLSHDCNYLKAPKTGPAFNMEWCRLCKQVAKRGRGRTPPGVDFWVTTSDEPFHTDGRCPHNPKTRKARMCSFCGAH